MTPDAPYMLQPGLRAARVLQRAGQWQDALDALPQDDTSPLRADVLTERYFQRGEGAAETEQAIEALADREPAWAALLRGQFAYTRVLFDRDPQPGDLDRARQGFAAAAGNEAGGGYAASNRTAGAGPGGNRADGSRADGDRPAGPGAGDGYMANDGGDGGADGDGVLRGWATFWFGVVTDNLENDAATASELYAAALLHAKEADDSLLESYVIRHQAAHLAPEEAVPLWRRSLYLRAAAGARPATAAAAITLAEALPPGAESTSLREAAHRTAVELGIGWLAAAAAH